MASQLTISANDGVNIFADCYGMEDATVKAVMIVCHGFGEHAGSYESFAKRMLQDGFACVIPTQRGHGRLSDSHSEQKKLQGVIPSYNCFLDDIESVVAVARQKKPDIPIILYGHSMGGNIAVNYLLKRNQSGFACAVLESPWFGLYNEVSPVTAIAAKALGAISPNITIINKLSFSDITGDNKKAKEIEADPLYHNRISFRMFAGIKNGCAYALDKASRLTVPIWLAYAKHEVIVSNDKIGEFVKKAGDNITMKEFASRHAIHNDLTRDKFYADLLAFLDEHCISRSV